MKTTPKRAVWPLLVLAATLTPAAAQITPTAAEALERARAAVGYERMRGRAGGFVAEGTARFRGLDSRFKFLFAPDGRFRSEVGGALGEVTSFDGATGWGVGLLKDAAPARTRRP